MSATTTKVSNFSDLIQRVTANCLLNLLGSICHAEDASVLHSPDDSDDDNFKTQEDEEQDVDEEDDDRYNMGDGGDSLKNWDVKRNNSKGDRNCGPRNERVIQMEMLIGEVFEAASAMKRAYVSLQEAHCPWDPDKMRVADVAVVAELRRIGVLRERFRRSLGNTGGG